MPDCPILPTCPPPDRRPAMAEDELLAPAPIRLPITEFRRLIALSSFKTDPEQAGAACSRLTTGATLSALERGRGHGLLRHNSVVLDVDLGGSNGVGHGLRAL